MAEKPKKPQKLKARLPRGLADRGPAEIAAAHAMIEKIRAVYELYGFEPVETPAIEFTDALGKFLPDQDRPNEGVFSFQDDDEQWLSLRYDLTAPLARHVAERIGTENFVLPYRSYRYGWVFRNEKPGPGRFRQFMQFDADTVGSASPAADAEMCMMAADAMEALGIPRGQYVVKVNNRKVLDGVMEAIGLGGDENAGRRLTVLRAMDKYDRLGVEGVRQLLSDGRKDESGDFTKGANLTDLQISPLIRLLRFPEIYSSIQTGEYDEVDTRFPNPFLTPPSLWEADLYLDKGRMAQKAIALAKVNPHNRNYDYSFGIDILGEVALLFEMNDKLAQGLHELAEIESLFQGADYSDTLDPADQIPVRDEIQPRVLIDPSVVRGLEYYTGPVFEVELLIETKDDKGRPVRFGSVGGGGRYDGLVSRFRGEPVPATGFSIGVSRLAAALDLIAKGSRPAAFGPVVVTVMDRDRIADYQQLVARLRNEGIRAELFLGNANKGIPNQLKYADARNSPCAIIQGSNERDHADGPHVVVQDLIAGRDVGADVEDRDAYLKMKEAARELVPLEKLTAKVREVLARHRVG